MAKTSGPLFSLDARGQVGKAIVYSIWKGVNYVRTYTVPKTGMDAGQIAQRNLITDASQAWASGATVGGVTLDSAYKLAFATAAAGQAYSGFNLYIKVSSLKNGGGTYDGSFAAPTDPTDITP